MATTFDVGNEIRVSDQIVDALHSLLEDERQRNSGPRGGDILVFLAGERDIREAANALGWHDPEIEMPVA